MCWICAVQAYSDASYDAYVVLGHGIDGYAGYPVMGTGLNPTCTGFNATVIAAQGGVTVGGTFYVLYVAVLVYQIIKSISLVLYVVTICNVLRHT